MLMGERLREERERIGLTQAALGAVGGVQKQAQLKYENGARNPTSEYLIEIAKVGIDVSYVLFGTRANNALTAEEEQLIATFRAAPPAVRQFMLGGIASASMKIEGNHNKQHKNTDADNMEIKGDNNVQIAGKARK
ncbi:helix-turn-helix domain-containing protein [Aggregatibacter kilianii]|uniref:helix-turn-helix domain-containing protein n=1 Tax=Aggregatibacter kilianii TaxID=2025884 RepID=UPI000D64A9B3|nr:helix-turn-helix transcriptional regulator [Aggregatibacter kilianii]